MSSLLPQSSVIAADPLQGIQAALFHRIGADGVYARTALYEGVLQGLTAFITRQRDPRAEVLRFPPVMSRSQLERSGYLKSFPNLLGCVCALHGTEAEIRAAADSHEQGGDWTRLARAVGPGAVAGCLLSGVPARRRRGVGCRRSGLDFRRGRGLLPPRAVPGARPPAVLPDARVRAHRLARGHPAFREQWMSRARSSPASSLLPVQARRGE